MPLVTDSGNEANAHETPELDLTEPWQVISEALADAFNGIKHKRPFAIQKADSVDDDPSLIDIATEDQDDVEMPTVPALDQPPGLSPEPVNQPLEKSIEPIKEESAMERIVPPYIPQHTTAWPLITIINHLDENVEPAIEYSNELRFHKRTSVPRSQYPGCPCENGGSYNEDGTIRSQQTTSIYECNNWCGCSGDCPNRVTQRPRSIPLIVERVCQDDMMAWAVKAQEFIPEGTYIDQYVGEVITTRIATKRSTKYTLEEESMVLDMRLGTSYDNSLFSIDPVVYGNVTRFFRHSETPNTKIIAIHNETSDLHFHRMAFFSIRDIDVGEELTFTNWNRD